MFYSFREYFAYRSCHRGNTDLNLSTDLVIKNFLKVIDSPDFYEPFLNFWVSEVLPFLDKNY